MREKRRFEGFTLFEVMLVVGIIGFLAVLAIPFYQSFQVTSQLDNATQELIQNLRRAQARAMASDGFMAWGVHLENKRYVLFRGSYSSADPFNEVNDLPAALSLTNNIGQDIVFTRVSGAASSVGSLILRTSSGQTSTISLNQLGVINAL